LRAGFYILYIIIAIILGAAAEMIARARNLSPSQ
jgi:biotin transporter BioY